MEMSFLKLTLTRSLFRTNPDSVHIGDKTISEVLSDNKNMTMLLSDDYQGIPVDSDGNYKTLPHWDHDHSYDHVRLK